MLQPKECAPPLLDDVGLRLELTLVMSAVHRVCVDVEQSRASVAKTLQGVNEARFRQLVDRLGTTAGEQQLLPASRAEWLTYAAKSKGPAVAREAARS